MKYIKTAYVLSPTQDVIWFFFLPVFAVAVGLAAWQWVPATVAVSIGLWITLPHHFATWLRTYGFSDEFQRWKDRLLVGPIVIIGITLVGMKWSPLTMLLLLMMWDHQHSLMQQYGFARIYDFKAGSGGPTTPRADFWLSWVLYGNMFLTAPLWTEIWVRELYQWDIYIAANTVRSIQTVSWTVLALYGIYYSVHISRSIRQGYTVNPCKYLFLTLSYGLWYFVSWHVASFVLYQVAHRLMHGLQYNAMVYSYIQRKVRKQGAIKGLMARLGQPGSIWALIILAGCYSILFEFLTGDGLEDFGFGVLDFSLRYDSISELGIAGMSLQSRYDIFAATLIYSAGIIHYYFDSFIWKVRDTKIQEGL